MKPRLIKKTSSTPPPQPTQRPVIHLTQQVQLWRETRQVEARTAREKFAALFT